MAIQNSTLHATLIPAYGRDYKTSEQALLSWAKGKDFKIASIYPVGQMGRYCSIRDSKHFLDDNITFVRLRFNKLTDFIDVDLT